MQSGKNAAYIVKKTEFTNTFACLQHLEMALVSALRHLNPQSDDDVSSKRVASPLARQRGASAAAIAMLEFVSGDSASSFQRIGS
jgi:hypothetical protein